MYLKGILKPPQPPMEKSGVGTVTGRYAYTVKNRMYNKSKQAQSKSHPSAAQNEICQLYSRKCKSFKSNLRALESCSMKF